MKKSTLILVALGIAVVATIAAYSFKDGKTIYATGFKDIKPEE